MEWISAKTKMRVALTLLPMLFFSCASPQAVSQADLSFTGKQIRIETGTACGARNINAGGQSFSLVKFPGNQNFHLHFHNVNHRTYQMLGLVDGNYPSYRFYDDSYAHNAWAINGGRDNYKIVYGANFILRLAEPIPGTDNLNTAAINSVIAHEAAHILQYTWGMQGTTKNIELMADAISGFVASGQERNSRVARDGLRIAQKHAYNSGDYSFADPSHHGTPSERLAAYMWGFDNGESFIHGEWVALDEFVALAARRFSVSY